MKSIDSRLGRRAVLKGAASALVLMTTGAKAGSPASVAVADVHQLLSGTAVGYGSGDSPVAAGDVVFTRLESYAYRVVEPDAEDFHIETAGGVRLKVEGGIVTPQQFGAIGDGESDDTAALQKAVDYAKVNGRVVRGVPGSIYIYRATIDASLPPGQTQRWTANFHACILRQDFEGLDQIGFSYVTPGKRSGGTPRLVGARFENSPTARANPPVMLDISGMSQGHFDEINFAGSANTQLRADSGYNNRLNRITSFYGGRHFPYRNTKGVNFSIDKGSATLKASEPHFRAEDAGRRMLLRRKDGRSETYIVEKVSNDRQAKVSRASSAQFESITGNWEGARLSVAGTRATIIGDPWPEDVEGLSIYIEGTGPKGQPRRHRIGKWISATEVDLTAPVETNVSGVRFGVAAVDMGVADEYKGKNIGNADTNFVTVGELFIENPRGIGMVVDRAANLKFTMSKIHGEAQPDGGKNATLAHIWAMNWRGNYSGTLEASDVGGAKIVNFDLAGKLRFNDHTRAQLAVHQPLVEHVNPGKGGIVEFESVGCIGNVSVCGGLADEVGRSKGHTAIGSISQVGLTPIFMD